MAPKRQAGGASIGRAIGKGTKAGGGVSKSGAPVKKSVEPARNATHEVSSPLYTKEQLIEAEGREELKPNDPRYDELWKQVQAKMGMPKNKPIHSECMNRIDHILRVFDFDPTYGPCLGITRLERWHRADELGDEPPAAIRQILQTRQGVLDYKFSVLHDKGV